MKKIKVNVKQGINSKTVLYDFGLFPDKNADAFVIVPEDEWFEFVDARSQYEIQLENMLNYKQKKI